MATMKMMMMALATIILANAVASAASSTTTSCEALEASSTKDQQQGSPIAHLDNSTTNNDSYVEEEDDMLNALFQWVADEGFISKSIQLSLDPHSLTRGIFATQDMAKGDVLITVPSHLTINSGVPTVSDDEEGEELLRQYGEQIGIEVGLDFYSMPQHQVANYFTYCDPIRQLYNTLTSNDDNTPYVKFLNAQTLRTLPSIWTSAGKDLLRAIIPNLLLGNLDVRFKEHFWNQCHHYYDLPDFDSIHGMYIDNHSGVDERINAYIHAWMILTARADDDILIPIYDMFNHRNGVDYNTDQIIDETSFSLVLTKDVKAGDELYNSYNQCSECSERQHSFGTPEIFLDYGFVEDFPRRFILDGPVRLKMDIDSDLKATFLTPLAQDGIEYMEWHVAKLKQTLEMKTAAHGSVPPHEWQAAWQMHNVYLTAFTAGLEQATHENLSDKVWEMGNSWYHPDWESIMDDDEDDDDDDDDEDEDE